MSYKVIVADNFHFMDEKEQWVAGSFDTLEEAVAKAKWLVDISLAEAVKTGGSEKEIYEHYKLWGDDPFIQAIDELQEGVRFSAWDYAKERCAALAMEIENRNRISDYDATEEQDTFNTLDASEQRAIRVLLELASLPLDRTRPEGSETLLNEQNKVDHTLQISAEGLLKIVPNLVEKLKNKTHWTDAGLNADVFFGAAMRIATFCRRNSLIRTFAGFDFLFVRMFGGEVRPLTPSLFAAAFLHPEFDQASTDAKELKSAFNAAQNKWGTHEPVWWPINHSQGPEIPLPEV